MDRTPIDAGGARVLGKPAAGATGVEGPGVGAAEGARAAGMPVGSSYHEAWWDEQTRAERGDEPTRAGALDAGRTRTATAWGGRRGRMDCAIGSQVIETSW